MQLSLPDLALLIIMCRLGLDCSDRLQWRGWRPGTEYIKALALKNVSTAHTLTITYKQTANKAFSMGFPEPIKLRPGMSHALQVRC
jgi:hypothetical protein